MNTLPPDLPKRAMLDFSQLEALGAAAYGESDCTWNIVRRSDNGADEHRTRIIGEKFTIGRRPDNDFCLAHNTVSGYHAVLELTINGLFVTDCRSTNGTLLNGKRVTDRQPLKNGDVVHFGQVVFSIEAVPPTQQKIQDFSNQTFEAAVPEDAVLYQGFDDLINRPDLDPHFQPIVDLQNESTIGYEVLVRSRIIGLEFPDKIFKIAAMRKAEARLSEVCRSQGLTAGIQLDPNGRYFLNTHATEFDTNRLRDSLVELRGCFPQMQIVLEIHEAAITSVHSLSELGKFLNDLDIELAYDDFGAGQARLIELFEVPPKYLKFDVGLVRALENASAVHRASVKALVNMVHDLDVVALAEGVETQVQADVSREIGFDMAQGYFFGRPESREYWMRQMVSDRSKAVAERTGFKMSVAD